jgi:hypothetical protein
MQPGQSQLDQGIPGSPEEQGPEVHPRRLARLMIADLALIGGARPDPARPITCGE